MRYKNNGEEAQIVGQIQVDNMPAFIVKLPNPVYIKGRIVRLVVQLAGEFERDKTADAVIV